jgi:hypothetical protein
MFTAVLPGSSSVCTTCYANTDTDLAVAIARSFVGAQASVLPVATLNTLRVQQQLVQQPTANCLLKLY